MTKPRGESVVLQRHARVVVNQSTCALPAMSGHGDAPPLAPEGAGSEAARGVSRGSGEAERRCRPVIDCRHDERRAAAIQSCVNRSVAIGSWTAAAAVLPRIHPVVASHGRARWTACAVGRLSVARPREPGGEPAIRHGMPRA